MNNFKDLLQQLGTHNTISNSPYDTAWVARLKNIEPEISNLALEWILKNQLPDGSWGTNFLTYPHDRIMSTLSALIALKQAGQGQNNEVRIQNGLNALNRIVTENQKKIETDFTAATVGFEVIVPFLIKESEQLGIIKQKQEQLLGGLTKLREIKMNKLKGIKFSRHLTIVHSSEIIGQDRLDLVDVENLQEKNGSVGNSPSATAHFALYVKPGDTKSLNYLIPLIKSRNGGAPTLSPIEIFERIWVLWNLSLTNLYQTNQEIQDLCNTHLNYIEKYWKPGYGISFSESFTPVDADNTSVGHEILTKFGRKADLDAVLHYEEELWFRCFDFETNPSIDVNIHVLGALKQAGFDKSNPSVQKALSFIRSRKHPDGYWFDKWNISPFYTTAHLVMQCKEYDDELCLEAVEWILKQQKENGAWGSYENSTAEETSYCVQALCIWQRYTGRVFSKEIELAGQWLLQNCEGPYPPLWIDKTLYCPEIIVQSSILSALRLIEEETEKPLIRFTTNQEFTDVFKT